MAVISKERLSDVHTRALTYMGPVRPNVEMIAIEVLIAAQAAGHTIKVVWGFNAASTPEHSAGTALDFMVYNDRAAGDWIAEYLWRNRKRLGLRWVIWYQRIRSTTSGRGEAWRAMADRGNSTVNHKDHPHANFWVKEYQPPYGAGLPADNPFERIFGMSEEAVRNVIKQELAMALRKQPIGDAKNGAYWPSSIANNVGQAARHAMNLDTGKGVIKQMAAFWWSPLIPLKKGEKKQMRHSSIRNNILAIETRTARLISDVAGLTKAVEALAKSQDTDTDEIMQALEKGRTSGFASLVDAEAETFAADETEAASVLASLDEDPSQS